MTSNYIWRGQSLSGNRPTAQVELKANDAFTDGLSFKAWGSGTTGYSQVNGNIDYEGNFNDSLSFNAGYIYYWYTEDAVLNEQTSNGEVYGTLSLDKLYSITAYIQDGSLDTHNITLEAKVGFEVNDKSGIDVALGDYLDITKELEFNNIYLYASTTYTYFMQGDYSASIALVYNSTDGLKYDGFNGLVSLTKSF